MRRALAVVMLALGLLITGCSTDAQVASENISKDADNFKVPRRIVFINGITDQYILEVTGYCSISDENRQLEVTCKVADGYKKHFLGLSDNVTYLAEQTDPADVSADQYRIIFKPSVVVPSIEAR